MRTNLTDPITSKEEEHINLFQQWDINAFIEQPYFKHASVIGIWAHLSLPRYESELG